MTDLAEAEDNYMKAKKQVEIWSQYPGGFASQQVEMWNEILRENAWCLPGATS